MFLGRGGDIVVKVINDDGYSVRGQMDVKLEEERTDRCGCGRACGKGKEDVAAAIRKFEKRFGC
jgi:hypothetical protein